MITNINIDFRFKYAETDTFSVIYTQGVYIALVKGKGDEHSPQSAIGVLTKTLGFPMGSHFAVKSSPVLSTRDLTLEFINMSISRFNERVGKRKRRPLVSSIDLEWREEVVQLSPFRRIELV